MTLKKKPVTGMKDILPKEMAIRDYVIRMIRRLTLRSASPPWRPPVWSTLRICAANREETMRS